MLLNLHVKNIALIEEADVFFKTGLNILTGETGAGKSIIIGSINLALGGRVPKDMLREDKDFALVELVFTLDENQEKQLKALDIMVEDHQLIMQRKMMSNKSVNKLNGETVTAAMLQKAAEILIDIHGQHEHQTLTDHKKQLDILDDYAQQDLSELKSKLKGTYHSYVESRKRLDESNLDKNEQMREMSLAEFEIQEIEEAALRIGEDEELEQKYRKMVSSRRLIETMTAVHQMVGYEQDGAAGECIGRALRELHSIDMLDDDAEEFGKQLEEVDNLLNDFNRAVAAYMEDMNFSAEEYQEVQERLNLINHLKIKYGDSVETILQHQDMQQQKLEKLRNYEEYITKLNEELTLKNKQCMTISKKISDIRKKSAVMLSKEMKQALIDLNFLEVMFEIVVKSNEDSLSANGYDSVEFMISLNPGERQKPLSQVASGGELSRIMLALKSVLADKDKTGTLIFDEIDAGISGRTAQKVSEKLAVIGGRHQVICITHLPQIASMADAHFEIVKKMEHGTTHTQIKELTEKESIGELARLLSGAQITDSVLQNAKEMKELAAATKKY